MSIRACVYTLPHIFYTYIHVCISGAGSEIEAQGPEGGEREGRREGREAKSQNLQYSILVLAWARSRRAG